MYTLQTLVLHRQIPQEHREPADHAWKGVWVPTEASMLHNLKKKVIQTWSSLPAPDLFWNQQRSRATTHCGFQMPRVGGRSRL